MEHYIYVVVYIYNTTLPNCVKFFRIRASEPESLRSPCHPRSKAFELRRRLTLCGLENTSSRTRKRRPRRKPQLSGEKNFNCEGVSLALPRELQKKYNPYCTLAIASDSYGTNKDELRSFLYNRVKTPQFVTSGHP